MDCPAVLISAPASGQGKTSVTAAIARHALRQGRRVRVFKTGPDFIDPMLLARASGAPVQQLDLFMGGLEHCRALLHAAAAEADLVLVEGVMGLYDGNPSSADLAQAFGLPVLAVIDAGGMAQTFGAVAQGLATYRPGLQLAGVIANGVGSPGHAAMLRESLPSQWPLVAALRRHEELALPERHLGLVQAAEVPDLEARLDRWAQAWAEAGGADYQAPVVRFEPQAGMEPPAPLLRGQRVAVARDDAFSFMYPANLQTLRELGAEVLFFSPLAGEPLPDCDALWLPGGYPELHAAALSANTAFLDALRAHHAAGKPLWAECGGMLVLAEALVDVQGGRHAMAGLLPGTATMKPRLQALGMQSVALPEGLLRGHSFHYSSFDTPLQPVARGVSPTGGRAAEAVYRVGRLTASYFHAYFPSNPGAVARVLGP
ncbi:cobyrinate a,c-diamide synthase [Azohydromonas caseinilytica]|uniref:cobyrinate a,c-diamide synthase n=1 Tax=Azohydromonas caseinilytica TaxID=2728836 RepID=UPI0028739B2B|nr:cobyrinate a,c-diamide synthase [Azohydromonas caseinilytica]